MKGPQVPVVTEKPLCLTNREKEFALMEAENKMAPSGICCPLSLHSAARFLFAVMLLVRRLITRTDECPDLLVADRETDREGPTEGERGGLTPAL